MSRASGFSRLLHSMFSFRRAEQGNIAVIFAIALVPILGFIGAAVDFSMVSRARSAMQQALDTAALMVAKDAAANNLTADQITAEAQNFFHAMYNHPEVSNVSITAAYSATPNPNLVLTGSGSMATDFMKMVGTPTMSFNLNSTIGWVNPGCA
jgi:Flp pilus assembly protein TadG